MYELFEKIALSYTAIVGICFMIFPFTIEKNEISNNYGSEERINGEECRWKKVLRNVILFLTMCICIMIIIWLAWNKEYIWILFPITLLTILERIDEAYISMGVVRKALNSTGDKLLSIKEQTSILAIAFVVGMMNIYKLPMKCLEIAQSIHNELVSDALLVTMLILFVTIYYFFIGATLLIPVKVLIRLGRWLIKKVPHRKIIFVIEKYKQWNQCLGRCEYISICFLEWGLKEKWRLVLVALLLIPTIIIDIFLKIAFGFLKIFLLIGEYVLNAFVRLIKLVIYFSCWIAEISDKRMVILFFRSALIFSLTSIVVVNRYMPVMKRYEEGTAVLEFFASAIVIPLVLSWVLEYKKEGS